MICSASDVIRTRTHRIIIALWQVALLSHAVVGRRHRPHYCFGFEGDNNNCTVYTGAIRLCYCTGDAIARNSTQSLVNLLSRVYVCVTNATNVRSSATAAAAAAAADENLFSSLFNEESAEYSMIGYFLLRFFVSLCYNFPMNSHFNQRPPDPSQISSCGDGDNARRVLCPNKSLRSESCIHSVKLSSRNNSSVYLIRCILNFNILVDLMRLLLLFLSLSHSPSAPVHLCISFSLSVSLSVFFPFVFQSCWLCSNCLSMARAAHSICIRCARNTCEPNEHVIKIKSIYIQISKEREREI